MNQYKTHNCGELRLENKGEEVRLAGWVQRIRNLGSMKFIDLRDQYGITQIVVTDNEEVKAKANELVTECAVSVTGIVLERTNKNPKMPTGDIEIEATKIDIVGKCKNVLPFEINSEKADTSLEEAFMKLIEKGENK